MFPTTEHPKTNRPTDFHGFRTLREYERECARNGFTTRREPFYKDGLSYFALITIPPKTPTSVSCWELFPADETVPILSGVINGVSGNYLGKLAAHGFYPVSKETSPDPSISVDADGQCRLLF